MESARKVQVKALLKVTPVSMMVAVQSTDVRDDFADGMDPAPLPGTDPSGVLSTFEPAEPLDEAPPRLCEAGPCRHYHRMDVQMDAANPRAERVGGRLVQHAKVFHVQVSHYCYPDVGIETQLGAMPVLACNRWVPVMGLLRRVTGGIGRARRAHQRELGAWHDRREAEARSIAEAAGLLEPPREMIVVFTRAGAEPVTILQEVDVETTLSQLISAAVRYTAIQLEQHNYSVELDGSPVNLDATINELELAEGTRIVVSLSHEPKEPA